jgi:hypothetical protein
MSRQRPQSERLRHFRHSLSDLHDVGVELADRRRVEVGHVRRERRPACGPDAMVSMRTRRPSMAMRQLASARR